MMCLRDHDRITRIRYTISEKVFAVGDDFWIEQLRHD
jgi:hypothetical protein